MFGIRPPKNARLKRYTMHGPSSSIRICPIQRRIVYSGNFAAQLPGVIRNHVTDDFRRSLNSQRMADLMDLACQRIEATLVD
jgi:hypothetical protein